MRGALVSLVVLSSACTDRGTPATLRAPGILRRALTAVGELEATAELVPDGGEPAPGVPLARGDDQISFTGFIDAAPGTYTLEIVFTGVARGGSDRLFLGRWPSDTFTVTLGDTVSPTFSRPLDTIGRPGDGGDTDADGLGLLDEILWGADPTASDSDGDGLRDGSDCDPIDPARTYPIAAGGSIEDCDADGALRMDIPYKPGGTDCDDRDPAKQTCPIDDREGPSITILDPTPDETVGCHRRIRARITDPSGVDTKEARFVSAGLSIEATIPMRPDQNDEYITNQFDLVTDYWLEDGLQRYQVRASDLRGNTSTASAQLTFALEVPTVTMQPAAIGRLDLPLDVRIDASASRGIAEIVLMRAPWIAGMDVDRSLEVEIGRAPASPASIRIDPTMIPEGRYAVYAIVTDSVGNKNKPSATFDPSGGATDADFLCIFDSGSGNVPVRELVIGTPMIPPGKEPARMKDHLDEAIAEAAAVDPNARLVEIRGWGMEPDGRIRLDDAVGGDGKWWRYEFLDAAEMRHVQVTWYSAASDTDNPEVVVDEGYVFTPSPIAADPHDLVDSDVAAAAFLAAGCPALVGDMNDDIRYLSDLPFTSNDVIRIAVGDTEWKATSTLPITEIWACP